MSRGKPQNPYAKPDRFTRAAKAQGFKARSVFKLSEVDQKLRLLRPGQKVVDLGCFPGSWSQYVLQRIGRGGALVGVDLSAPELPGGTFLARSVMDVSAEELRAALGGAADLVLSDMAPATTGVPFADHARQLVLARRALELAVAVLAPGGALFAKVFDGEEVPAFQAEVRAHFAKVKRYRPEAVRESSREFFLLGEGFAPRPG
jgi:23S rRNA (uridine2552-2'-O)-methyltransferase